MADEGRLREKLIARKEEWARDGRLLTGEVADASVRLPPGQLLVSDWPVLDLGIQPDITPARFRLDIDGMVGRPLSLSLDEFRALPRADAVSDMHCVTAWSRYDNHWQGVTALELVERVAPKDEASHVIFHAHDGYTTNVRLDQFARPGVLLVDRWQDQPISRQHGGPVRVLIPQLYLWKSAKWIRRIEFTGRDRPGFWEVRGYNNNADPWLEERYE
jgi:DMSO/TMAO reductase YedYZ molybdopterin-dependent catalytic subunit